MGYKPLPSQKLLREWFDYDPETGVILYRDQPSQDARGRPRYPKPRDMVSTPKGQFQTKRVIWKLHYGIDPDGVVITKNPVSVIHPHGIDYNRKITNLYVKGN